MALRVRRARPNAGRVRDRRGPRRSPGTAGPRLTVGSSKFLALSCGRASALRPAVGVEEVGEGYGFLAVGAEPAEPDAGARLVAVRAPLRAVVAGLARWAGVDGGVAAWASGRDVGVTGVTTSLGEVRRPTVATEELRWVGTFPASATSTSNWSGTHPGARTGCRRPPGSNSECTDRARPEDDRRTAGPAFPHERAGDALDGQRCARIQASLFP